MCRVEVMTARQFVIVNNRDVFIDSPKSWVIPNLVCNLSDWVTQIILFETMLLRGLVANVEEER